MKINDKENNMIVSRIARQLWLTVCLMLIAVVVFAQTQPESGEYKPEPFQSGKDVVWVPTAQALADKMLNLARVTAQDYVIDLGSGDGRIVISAAKRGARALGIEYNPDMVTLSKRNAAMEGVGDRAQFTQADLFESDFSQATVITMFLLPEINLKLRPRILDLKPGTRVVSNSFTMGEWKADETVVVNVEEGCDNQFCEAYFWVVPAKVEGVWKLPKGELRLKQSFQMISGTLKSGSQRAQIANGRLNGDLISFTAGKVEYRGRVNGNTMQGTGKSGGSVVKWNANRAIGG